MLTELQSFNCHFGQYSGTLDYGVPGPPTIFIRLITFFQTSDLKKLISIIYIGKGQMFSAFGLTWPGSIAPDFKCLCYR